MASYLSKVADFYPTHLQLAPSLGVTQIEFRRDLWRQKIPVLSCGIVCVILRLARRFDTIPACDGQADKRTNDDSIYRARR